MENPIKMDNLGGTIILETLILLQKPNNGGMREESQKKMFTIL